MKFWPKFKHFIHKTAFALRWLHNDHAGVSNHQPHGCLLNRFYRRTSKKTSKLRVTGLCAGNSPGTGEFPAQMASYAENVSIWWRHHGKCRLRNGDRFVQLQLLWTIIRHPLEIFNDSLHGCWRILTTPFDSFNWTDFNNLIWIPPRVITLINIPVGPHVIALFIPTAYGACNTTG